MPKQTLKEKEVLREKEERKQKGYKDFWYLLLIVLGVWMLEAPAVVGLILSDSREHFNSYGIFMLVVSVVGFLATVLLLAFDKRRASIVVSCISAGLILLFCALIYAGYESAINTSNMNVMQIIVSYVTPLAVPIADIIMVNRRL
ncbi:MAG: hypothetical protein IJ370_04175 [Oscillospiraceae bacterium]|nr:hypothetical protein [Oscillospiraceae bacterium]